MLEAALSYHVGPAVLLLVGLLLVCTQVKAWRHTSDIAWLHTNTGIIAWSPLCLEMCNSQNSEIHPWSYTLARCVPSRCARQGDMH